MTQRLVDGVLVDLTPDEQAAFDAKEAAAAASALDSLKASLVIDVDDHIAGLYAKWTRFQKEYESRESAAQAFKDAGYSGDPGVWVSRFATNTGKTNQEAADLILGQATALRTALQTLGALRMDKYLIQAQATSAAARMKHSDIITAADAAVVGL